MSWAEENGIDNSLMAEEFAEEMAWDAYYLENDYWRDKFGNVHEISKMSTSYLENCLRKIDRENWRKEYREKITNELKRRKNDFKS